MEINKLNVLDLFCGAGGLSLGFLLTEKFHLLGGIDNWKPAIETISYNHPEIENDNFINDSVGNTLKSKDILNKFKDVDIIMGGPPCQGMSLAGKRLSNDPRNQLFKDFVSYVDILKPKAFLMENVPGILSIENGAINQAILSSFKSIGYSLTSNSPVILKSEYYGVPQIRRRLFYLGFRKDIKVRINNWPPPITHGYNFENKNQLSFDFTSDLKNVLTVKDAISDLPRLKNGEGEEVMKYSDTYNNDYQKMIRLSNTKNEIYNHVSPNHTDKLLELISKAKAGQSVDPNYTDSKKWHPDKPGYTVKALGAGGGSTNRRAFHYKDNRGSTVRENARIQSFPDSYRFLGSKTNQMSQVGNSVPPLLAKSIANEIYKILNNYGN